MLTEVPHYILNRNQSINLPLSKKEAAAKSLESIDTADGLSIGQYDDFAERHRVAKETCFISKPIRQCVKIISE